MSLPQKYQAALDYIFSYVDYSKTHAQNLDPANFQLDRVFSLLEKIGDPHKAFPSIHIAGTKGKGSASVFCAAALQAAGYKTGLYTSPHLQDFTERIQINRRPIPYEEVAGTLELLKLAVESTPGISTFEIITALGFKYFASREVDIAVIEVGLGGRLDATNVLSPLVSLITTISLDHTAILGSTLGEIAGEKAGIIKAGVPVISSPQPPEAWTIIEQVADRQQAPLTAVGREIHFSTLSTNLEKQTFQIWAGSDAPIVLSIPLLGLHQVENAAAAWGALQAIRAKGFPVSEQALLKGFADAQWPGRLEILRTKPFVILDAAHNPDSGLRLSEALNELLPGKPITLVIGVSGDKDVGGFIAPLLDRIDNAIATRTVHPRALDPLLLAENLSSLGLVVAAEQKIENAVERALATVPEDGIILVTGSVFLVGAAREVWPLISAQVNL